MNPLLQTHFHTPYETIPFPDITVEHLSEAIHQGMQMEDAEIRSIIDNPESPTFDNTIVPLAESGEVLGRATTVLYNLLSAETSDELEALAEEMTPKLTAHESAISMNPALFQRVKVVASLPQPDNAEDRMLLEKTLKGFLRAGAGLDDAGKQRLKEIKTELGQLTLQFNQNNIKETNAFELYIEQEGDLAGLPATAIEAAAIAAKEHGKPCGWLFTLHAPSYLPFIRYSEKRELRKQLYMAYATRCAHDNEQNNLEICRRIVNLRTEMAQLLGYPTFAAYALDNRMAGTAQRVTDFLQNLCDHYLMPAQKDLESVRQFMNEEGGADGASDAQKVEPWDLPHYSFLLKRRDYDVDPEMLRPYLPLEKVIDGVFGLATRLYGITFQPNPSIPVYHEEVKAYEVLDANGDFLAVLYADFFPRAGKQSGAWMTSYRDAGMKRQADGSLRSQRPHVSVTMNFAKPTPAHPALLTLGEVTTFLHEFGHALHGIFAATRYTSLSGTSVLWDFVELPSQFMENYALEPEFLRTFAYHYETGEPLPEEWIERIRAARNFMAGYDCMRQVSFGLLDMELYTRTTPIEAAAEGEHPLLQIEHEVWRRIGLSRPPRETCMLAQFGHIMSGGYAAGYYSYKWAEVLEADAFECFRREGIFNAATAQRFRDTILSQGGTRHPSELYRDFRGQEATIDAMLRRDGLA